MKTKAYAKYNEINSLQVFFLVFLTQVGTGLLSLPRDVTKIAGHDGWISVILATLLSMIMAGIAVKLAWRFKGLTLIEINRKLFGYLLGTLLSLVYFSYFFVAAALQIRTLTGLVAIWILPQVSTTKIMILCSVALVYLTRNGIKVMARAYNLYFYHLLPLAILLIWPAGQFEPRLIFPVFTEGLLPIAKGIKAAALAFSGFETILMLNPFIMEPKKLMRPVLGATILAGLFYTMLTFVLTAFLVIKEMQHLLWPTIYVARMVQVAFLERLDVLIDIIWVIVVFTTLAMYYYLAAFSFARIFNKKEHKNFTLILLLPMMLLTEFSQSISHTIFISNYIGIAGMVLGGILPLILLVISLIKYGKGGADFES